MLSHAKVKHTPIHKEIEVGSQSYEIHKVHKMCYVKYISLIDGWILENPVG